MTIEFTSPAMFFFFLILYSPSWLFILCRNIDR